MQAFESKTEQPFYMKEIDCGDTEEHQEPETIRKILARVPNAISSRYRNEARDFILKTLPFIRKGIIEEGEIMSMFNEIGTKQWNGRLQIKAADIIKEILTHDPLVILGKSYRSDDECNIIKLLNYNEEYIKSELKKHVISEDKISICKYIIFGIIPCIIKGDYAQVPVLVGPPGSGKSILPIFIQEILESIGIRVGLHFESFAEDKGHNDEISMRLLGIDSRWANSCPGEIFNKTRNNDIVIIVADEIDKKEDSRLLLELFDSTSPLADRCIQTMAHKMNLRYKTIFIGTANHDKWSNNPLCPVSSRVKVIRFKPYSDSEKKLIVYRLLDLDKYTTEQRKFMKRIIDKYIKLGLDLRKIRGEVNVLKNLVINIGLCEAEHIIRKLERSASNCKNGRIGFVN